MDDRECSAAITAMQELGSRGGPVVSEVIGKCHFLGTSSLSPINMPSIHPSNANYQHRKRPIFH